VLIPATLIVAVDHFIRGMFWPESVYGVVSASSWRWLEHAGWVLFEDAFLILSCSQAVREMQSIALRTSELESSHQTNRDIIESSLDAVVRMSEEGRITAWNVRAEQTFGWTAAEAVGQELAELIVPERLRAAHVQGLERYRRTRTSHILHQRLELSALHRDGHEFPVELVIAPILTGETLSFCAFANDITKRRAAEEALRQAKEAAEAANRAKSEFLANMSHEIRTPLNAVLGFSELLIGKDQTIPAEELRDHLRTIHTSGRHLLDLVNDILDLSKIEAGQLPLEHVPCSPHEIVAEVVSLLRVRAAEKNLKLDYRWNGGIPATIRTDPARLRQVLLTEQGGVQIVIQLDRSPASPKLEFTVADTGIGIAADKLQSVFEPFVQADTSVTRRFGGTGLGLAISRRLTRLLGGELTLESRVGHGSTFRFSIATGALDDVQVHDVPPHAAAVGDITRAGTASLRLPRARILLVEDGDANRKLLKIVLGRAGCEVTTAENGQVGVELGTAQAFDLILMDMQMPVLDGYTATRQLRDRGLTLPIIALTAHALKGDEERCREAGCSGYLTKPIEALKLLAAVAQHLTARSSSSSSANVDHESHEACEPPLISSLLEDPEMEPVVLDFVDVLRRQLPAFRAAVSELKFDELARLAHWLKGTGGTMGYDELSEVAQRLEELAEKQDGHACESHLRRLDRLVARIPLASSGTA
jgi:PAS domain S-box-containing protein